MSHAELRAETQHQLAGGGHRWHGHHDGAHHVARTGYNEGLPGVREQAVHVHGNASRALSHRWVTSRPCRWVFAPGAPRANT
eukprot:3626815-Lingulodinium_polyedra.AAC.1